MNLDMSIKNIHTLFSQSNTSETSNCCRKCSCGQEHRIAWVTYECGWRRKLGDDWDLGGSSQRNPDFQSKEILYPISNSARSQDSVRAPNSNSHSHSILSQLYGNFRVVTIVFMLFSVLQSALSVVLQAAVIGRREAERGWQKLAVSTTLSSDHLCVETWRY